MPTMTFSFVCHTAILPIYAELKSKSAGQMKKIAGTTMKSAIIKLSIRLNIYTHL